MILNYRSPKLVRLDGDGYPPVLGQILRFPNK
jgi:hypothetical protein